MAERRTRLEIYRFALIRHSPYEFEHLNCNRIRQGEVRGTYGGHLLGISEIFMTADTLTRTLARGSQKFCRERA